MFRLTSPAFEDGEQLAQKYGKRAQNVSPPLDWEDVPEGTRSFALSFVDIDPVARGYVHWLVADISPQLSSLPEGAASNLSALDRAQAVRRPLSAVRNPQLRVHAVRPDHRQAQPAAGSRLGGIQEGRGTELLGHRHADRKVHEDQLRLLASEAALTQELHFSPVSCP